MYASVKFNFFFAFIHYSFFCDLTSAKKEDVISTLQHMNLINYYKGQYIITLTADILKAYQKVLDKKQIHIDPKMLHWTAKDWSKRGKWWVSPKCHPFFYLLF